MSEAGTRSLVERGRVALEAHQWRAAYDALSEADAAGALNPDELELLASAAWWSGRLPDAIEAARISGAASGGEILVSEATLHSARRQPPVGERRVLELKGVSAPAAALPIRWERILRVSGS
jgi:hypothetical protein